MPYGGAQVGILLIDSDAGDKEFYGNALKLHQYLEERLIMFKVRDRDRDKDVLELTLRNDDFAMIDTPVFAKGQKLLVAWGWPGELKPPRRFIVQSVKGSNPVVVRAHCRLSIMDTEGKSRLFENMTDSEIAAVIAEEYGYIGNYQWIEQTNVRRDINQGRRTDARLLAWRARQNGFVFYEDASGLHFHKKYTGIDAAYWYTYRTDGMGEVLSEPKYDINMTHGISKVKVMFRDPRTKEYGEEIGGPDDTEMNGLGEEDEMGNADDPDQGRRAGRMTRIDTRYEGVITREEAKVIADARYRMTAEKRYKMTVSVIGNKVVGGKTVVGFLGISDALDGLYYISESEDTIAGGKFTQELKCEKSALNKVKTAGKARKGEKVTTNPSTVATTTQQEWQLRTAISVAANSSGQIVPVYVYVDETGFSGVAVELTPAEINALDDRTLENLHQSSAQTAEPDTAN